MNLLVIPVIFLAMFTQSLAGFGAGLVAMPMLIALIGLESAVPAFALTAQTGGLLLMLRYRDEWKLGSVWRLLLMSLLGVVIGIWGSGFVDEGLAKSVLGLFTISYAVYSLLGLHVPAVPRRWGYGFGLVSGLLSGAYNMGGPPLVIFGSSQRWGPGEFKSNISSVFFPTGIMAITTHFAAGNITTEVLQYYGLMAPTLLVAMSLGFMLDRYIKTEQFRKVVQVLLVILGISLLTG